MKTLIFSWNPATSFYTQKEYEEDFKYLKSMKKSTDGIGLRWPVAEYKKIKPDDEFYVIRCGEGMPEGIVMQGFVLGKPYLSEDPCHKGENTYFVDVCVAFMSHPTEGPVLPLRELESSIPSAKWSEAYPATILSPAQRMKLDGMFARFFFIQTSVWANSPYVYNMEEDLVPEHIANLKKAAQTYAASEAEYLENKVAVDTLAKEFEDGANWARKQGKEFFYGAHFRIDYALQEQIDAINEHKLATPENEESSVCYNAFSLGAYWYVRRNYYKSFFEDPIFTNQKGLTPSMFMHAMEFLTIQCVLLKDGSKLSFADLYHRTIKNTKKMHLKILTPAFVWPQMESMYLPFKKTVERSQKLIIDFLKPKNPEAVLPWEIPFIKNSQCICPTQE